MPFPVARAAFWPLAALLLTGTAAAIQPPAFVPGAVAAACVAAGPVVEDAGFTCAYLAHLAGAPCDAPIPGILAACDVVARPCAALPQAAARSACEASGLVPLQTARVCATDPCARLATGDGGASAVWSATSSACFEADVCHETQFTAQARANLPGTWILEHAREIRQDPGDQVVPYSHVEGSCTWRDEGGCLDLATGPSLRLAPSAGDARALATYALWWRDSLGQMHLQATGASCTHLPAPGSGGSC